MAKRLDIDTSIPPIIAEIIYCKGYRNGFEDALTKKEEAESMTDLISREEAVKALGERPMVWGDVNEYELGRQNQFDEDYTAIMNVPRSDDVLLAELIKMEERRNYWEEMALSYERTIYKLQKAIERLTNETNQRSVSGSEREHGELD